jgi:hypothetical protein
MSFFAMIPSLLGMGAQAAGGAQAASSTKEGARTQAGIEAMNRRFQEDLFKEEMGRLQPRHQMGTERVLPLLGDYLNRGQIDLNNMPLYQAQRGWGTSALQGQGMNDPFTMNRFNQGLTATENEASYGRLSDALQLAMGASAAAGQGSQNYASGLASSFLNEGNALAGGRAGAARTRQGMYGNLAGQASSIPAYMSQSNYLRG